VSETNQAALRKILGIKAVCAIISAAVMFAMSLYLFPSGSTIRSMLTALATVCVFWWLFPPMKAKTASADNRR
jgi:hypothetical protein